MSHVTSRDGTKIAFERTGNGPALILVDGALCSRAFGPSAKLASAFAATDAHVSVYRYDRRGRGESGDTEHYAIDREIEDLDALIAHAGGSAALLAFVPIMMRLMPWVWRKLVAVAHTLPYDAAVMTGFRVPQIRFASIRQPVLVLNGSKTDPRLQAAARAVVAAVPEARHGVLAGQTHNVKPDALVTGSLAFLSSGRTLAARS